MSLIYTYGASFEPATQNTTGGIYAAPTGQNLIFGFVLKRCMTPTEPETGINHDEVDGTAVFTERSEGVR